MELPHTEGCIVCGRGNPHGLHLRFHVDDAGVVSATYTPAPEHIGFQGIVHGGVLSTVLDEAMVWAAIWGAKRFCVAGELTVRFRSSAAPGVALAVETHVASVRSRLIETTGEIRAAGGATLIATAEGKYVPLPWGRTREFIGTLVNEPATAAATAALIEAAARGS